MAKKLLPLVSQIITGGLVLFGVSGLAQAEVTSGESNYKLCSYCHGVNGEGKESIAAPAIAGLPKWYILNQFEKYQNGARGWHADDLAGKRMRPMARTLLVYDDEDAAKEKMDQIADYVANMKPQVPNNDVSGNLVNGEKKYQVCIACHGADGRGNKLLNSPPLVWQNDWYMLSQLKAFKNGWRGVNPAIDATGASMRPNAMTLEEQDMIDVIAYIQELRDMEPSMQGAE